MVSLSENSRRSGGYFFDDDHSTNQTFDSEDVTRDVGIIGESSDAFKRINSAWAIIVEIFLSVALLIGSFVVPIICKEKNCGTDDISIIIYAHGGLWFVLLLFDRYYRQVHYVNRLNGYLEFYRRTKNIRRLPFVIASGGNATLLIVNRILEEYCSNDKGHNCPVMQKEGYIQIVITLESLMMLLCLVVYLIRTVQFNRCAAHPDVSQDEMLTSFLQSQSQSSDIGFRDETYLDQVLEKQADMIRYLKQHNSQLGKRILTLTTENNLLKA